MALEGKFAGFEGKFNTFKAEMFGEFEKRMGALETKFEQAQVKLQDTITSTMKWNIGIRGLILILLLLESLDIFVKWSLFLNRTYV